jgi:hypothetical protein
VFDSRVIERGSQAVRQLFHPCVALLPGDAKVSEAHVPRPGGMAPSPQAGVEAWVDRNQYPPTQVDSLPPSNTHHALKRDPRLLKQPHGLITADKPGPSPSDDAFGAPKMIEMGMTDDNPVTLDDGVSCEPRTLSVRRPINVRVEEYGDALSLQAKRRASEPVEGRSQSDTSHSLRYKLYCFHIDFA